MRHRRLYGTPGGGPDPDRGPRSGSSTAATTRPGIALVDEDGDLFVEKRAGKLANLQTAIADRTPHAAIGLAHTRWATHGRPNDLNAHPHQDCTGDITVIHNGIIENFRELRDGLEARGHTLTSETDTEAIAHLVEEAYEGDLADAVRAALRQARRAPTRSSSCTAARSSRLVGARKDVPLVVGLADGETLPRQRRRGDPRPHEPGRLPRGGRRRRPAADGRRRSPTSTARPGARSSRPSTGRPRPPRRAATSTSCSRRSTSSPRRSRQCDRRPRHPRRPHPARGARRRSAETLRAVDRIELVACGTAYYAALVGAAAIQDWTGLPARATVGSEFRYSPPPLDGRTLVIAVTQSGETADTIAPTRLARERGCPIVAVTNTVGSAITREARRGRLPPGRARDRGRGVQDVRDPGHDARDPRRGDRQGARRARAANRSRSLPPRSTPCPQRPRGRSINASGVAELARRYVNSRGFMFVGRGYTYPTALEGALKLKEVSYVHAEGYAAGELKHGPISLLDAECPLVAVATRSSVYDKLISNVMEGRARDARVIAVATEGDPQIERFADDVCWVPDTHEALSPVLAIIPLQLFAYHVAVARGTDVDQPRNLAKSVTVE